MSRQEMLFNPVMEIVNGIEKPAVPYVENEDRTTDPYLFDLDQNDIPLFTDKNIKFVNGMVENDSNYNQTDKEKVRDIFKDMFVGSADERMACIGRAVYEIDNENSTHLTAVGRHKVVVLMEIFNIKPTAV